jgi:hypothetical protein
MAEIRTLGLSGFDRAEEAAFRALFDRAAGSRWQLGPEADADALLIDFDSMYGQMAWLKAAQDAERPIAALTASPRAATDFLLQRPVTVERLADLLAGLDAVLSGHPIPARTAPEGEPSETRQTTEHGGDAPEPHDTAVTAAPAHQPEPAPRAPAPPPSRARPLLEYLRRGGLPGAVRLAGAEPPLAIDPIGDTYVGGSALKPLAVHCRQPIEPDRWEAITPAEFERMKAAAGGTQPLNRLRWLAGLCAFGGALDPRLADASRFKLARWPQSEREYPKHFRIATAMLKQSGDLDELAAASGAGRDEVADFVNACHAIGMVEIEGPNVETAPEPAARGGLMSRLRGKG